MSENAKLNVPGSDEKILKDYLKNLAFQPTNTWPPGLRDIVKAAYESDLLDSDDMEVETPKLTSKQKVIKLEKEILGDFANKFCMKNTAEASTEMAINIFGVSHKLIKCLPDSGYRSVKGMIMQRFESDATFKGSGSVKKPKKLRLKPEMVKNTPKTSGSAKKPEKQGVPKTPGSVKKTRKIPSTPLIPVPNINLTFNY